MENTRSSIKCSFKCNRWLSKTEDDHQIIRELPAVIQGKEPLSGNKASLKWLPLLWMSGKTAHCEKSNTKFVVHEVRLLIVGFSFSSCVPCVCTHW